MRVMSFSVRIMIGGLFAVAPLVVSAQMAAPVPTCVAAVTAPESWRDPRVRDSVLAVARPIASDVMHDAVGCVQPSRPVRVGDLRLALPSVNVVWQSALADSRDDGGLWAGRGLSVLGRVGFYLDANRFHLAVVPEVWRTENRPFFVVPNTAPSRSTWASPFYKAPASIDWPLRMGADPIVQFSTGQSAIWYQADRWMAGWSSSAMTWGPAHSPLLLSANAEGIRRVFASTARPLPTRVGLWTALFFVGDLAESRFFDRDIANDRRSLTFLGITWTPRDSSGVTLGLARAVSNLQSGGTGRDVSAVFARQSPTNHDDMVSFFARAQRPDGRLRGWVELIHQGPLRLRELLTEPRAELGYAFGLEAADRRTRGSVVYLAEVASVEQSRTLSDREVHDFYTGYGTPQGWTNRGQMLGAGIGPGGQSQLISADWVTRAWSLGGQLERVRWNEDALYKQYLPYPNRHDVSVRASLRAGFASRGVEYQTEFSWGRRVNYLFHNADFIVDYRTIDVPFSSLGFSVRPSSNARR